MNWGDLKFEDIKSIFLHCANCNIITDANKSDGFKCDNCGKFALVLEGDE